MLWGVVIALAAIIVLWIVVRLLRGRPDEVRSQMEMPLETEEPGGGFSGGAEPAEPMAFAISAEGQARIQQIARAQRGDCLILPQSDFAGDETSFRVDAVHRYVQGEDEWVELECRTQARPLFLEVWAGEDPEISFSKGEPNIPLEMLQLTEDRLAEIDETGDANVRLTFRGAEWAFAGSGECMFHEDGGPEAEGFYGWEFREIDGLRVLFVEKWEDEPFRVGLAELVDPESIRLAES